MHSYLVELEADILAQAFIYIPLCVPAGHLRLHCSHVQKTLEPAQTELAPRLTFFMLKKLCMKFIMLINVRKPTRVNILPFISMINTSEFESKKVFVSAFQLL